MTSPEHLERLIRSGRPDAVREALARLDEAERKALHPVVQAINRREVRERLPLKAAAALVVAQVGTVSGAGATADVLRVRSWTWRQSADDVVGALLDRGPSWLPAVVERLAERLDITSFDAVPFQVVEALRVATDTPRPTAGPYLLGMVASLDATENPIDLLDLLRTDAELAGLVPVALAVDDVGTWLRTRDSEVFRDENGRLTRRDAPVEQTWPGALAVLSADGLLDRSTLLVTVLESLMRGGKRDHVAGMLAVHDALAPTAAEVAGHRRTYTRLVADGPGTVATTSLRLLRSATGEGAVDADGALEAADGAVRRREKGLATAGLTWLQQLAKAGTAPVDEVARVAGAALEHERRDVQERGLRLLAGLAPSLQPGTLEQLRAVAAGLPAVLRPDVEAALGPLAPLGSLPDAAGAAERPTREARTGSAARVVPGDLVAAAEPAVANLAGLAEAVAAHLETGDPRTVERVLDGVSRFAVADPDGLRSATRPFDARLRTSGAERRERERFGVDEVPGSWESAATRLLRAVLAPPGRGWFGRATRPRELQRWAAPEGVVGCADVRGREVAERVLRGWAGPLLATPTARTGALDPEAVLERLQAWARLGVEPGVYDLEQAWLRLPRTGGDPGWPARARAVGSRAAVWLAGAVEQGPPEPTYSVAPVPPTVFRWGRASPASHAGIPVVDVRPPRGDVASLVVRALTPKEPLPATAAREWWEGPQGRWEPLSVLLALPQHREVTAAHLLPALLGTTRQCPPEVTEALALLPEAGGPTGPATALAIGWAATGSDLSARTAAADALRGFAATGGLDGPTAGRVLGPLLLQPTVSVGRVASTLSDAARGDRATQRLVWDLLEAALPAVLAEGRRGVADLLGVAAEVAAEVGARGTVDGLDAVAGPGGTRLATEARRLHAVLSRV